MGCHRSGKADANNSTDLTYQMEWKLSHVAGIAPVSGVARFPATVRMKSIPEPKSS